MSERQVDLSQYVRPHSDEHEKHRPLTDEERLAITKKLFPLGCRVGLSHHALDLDRFQKERKGGKVVVAHIVGYSRENEGIVVLVEGRKRPTTWHRVFWERTE